MKNQYYLEFENRFRGDQEKVFDLLSMYEPLIDLVIKNNDSSKLLDIGCGRGELLKKWKYKFASCIGIESDESMIKKCREYGLSIIEGDALDRLKDFEDRSVNVITMFHIIEHIEHNKLLQLIQQCERVLTDNGVLIMETPSIDNLIVSSKTFHLDHTHINPINPDGLSFSIEQCGFCKVKYFYLHGGPLQNDNPLKITRILNGVAQDVLFIATKSEHFASIIFRSNQKWKESLDMGITTLDSAIDYDLILEKTIKDNNISLHQNIADITLLKEEINLLKAELKYLFKFLKSLDQIKNFGLEILFLKKDTALLI